MEPDAPSTTPSADVARDSWQSLSRYTSARIALGRAGASVPTTVHLDFQLAHAQARDAVHHPLTVEALAMALQGRGWESLRAHSAASDRRIYLQRPDQGRRLDAASRACLAAAAAARAAAPDLCVVLADGLSPHALERHAVPLLEALRLALASDGLSWAPLVIVEQGRVALGDEVGALFGARLVLILIGERPGLSSPDSLGAYLTFAPRPGTPDSARNCVSNIRPEGLAPEQAAATCAWLIRESLRRGLTGIALKEDAPLLPSDEPGRRLVAPSWKGAR